MTTGSDTVAQPQHAPPPPRPAGNRSEPLEPIAMLQPRSSYPARLAGQQDTRLSRWLWLVKWALALPHYVILLFLWFAFAVTTVVAGVAILFTGRYPRPLFAFNVGVLRWSWRVGSYAYAAPGTDRYPPFTLFRTDYPADVEVDYPERALFDLVLGLNRWQYRVITYVALMRDEYPPFYLDQGGDDGPAALPRQPRVEPEPVGGLV